MGYKNLSPSSFSSPNPTLNLTYLKIDVTDNGKGIPPETKPHIFEDHHTDQSDENWDGTGLGLSICVQLCKQMNAFIKYRSELGVGSEFSFYMPIFNVRGPKMSRRISITSAEDFKQVAGSLEHDCNEV